MGLQNHQAADACVFGCIGKDYFCLRVHLRVFVAVRDRTAGAGAHRVRDRHAQHCRQPATLPEDKYVTSFHSIEYVLYAYAPPLGSNCEHCQVRHKMQQKYLKEAHELYDEFFHIVQLPLLTEEVRGPAKLKEFSKMLVTPYAPPQ